MLLTFDIVPESVYLELPYLSNPTENQTNLSSVCFHQHLSRMVDYGNVMILYRSFNIIDTTSVNFYIYSFLAQLERRLIVYKSLLDIIYLTFTDSKYCNKYMLAICEILIVQSFTKKIEIIRQEKEHQLDFNASFDEILKNQILKKKIFSQLRIWRKN
jgi:hypothetical protein